MTSTEGESHERRATVGLDATGSDLDRASSGNREPDRPLTLLVTRQLFWIWVIVDVLLLVGGGVYGATLFIKQAGDPTTDSLLAAVAMSFAGAGCYYLRRIYKASISGRLKIVDQDELKQNLPRVVGTSLYILSRPLIAALLALFVAMSSAAAWFGCAPTGVEPTRGLVQIAAVSGFLVGYFSGRSISQLESSGKIMP